MGEEADYLSHYRADHLYVNPAPRGAYATMVGDNEELIAEIDVTARCKLAVSAFYVNDRQDYNSFKLTKLCFHKRFGWREDSHLKLNNFQLSQMKEFISIIASLDLKDAVKSRISLESIQLDALGPLLGSSKGAELIRKLAHAPELHQDIYAITSKKEALVEFEDMLDGFHSEADWQFYFEKNPWIFGLGLNYIFLDKVGDRLESVTTGSAFDRDGKRVDALMKTKAEVSQYVLVEIKKSTTGLVQQSAYRPGCWAVSREMSDAVTQVQKSSFEFSQHRFRDLQKDDCGRDTGESIYCVEPRCYLVIGDLREIIGHEDKIACFELYRRNIRTPEIITFDELYQRAKCLVENITQEVALADAQEPEEIPGEPTSTDDF